MNEKRMTITPDDEREAREWLKSWASSRSAMAAKYGRTLLALLDAAEAAATARDAALEEALSASGVIDFLRFEVEQAGGQKEWALANGVSPQLVNDVLHGRRAPSAKICKPLGLVRTTRYVRAPRGAA